VDGVPLSTLAALTPEIGLAAQRTLRLVHQCGVLHGDIRLDNIMLLAPTAAAPGPRIVFVDFGLSRMAGHDELDNEERQLDALFQHQVS
jgi:tRNA A-37 threonylcarbamoyl transferase component Bud32